MLHAAAAAVAVTLALVGLPNCSEVNRDFANGLQPFGASALELRTSDGAVASSIPFGATWFRRPSASMQCTSKSSGDGADSTGPFSFTTYAWAVGSADGTTTPFETVLKSYTSRPALGFLQRWPNGAQSTASGNADGVISAFPALMLNHSGTPLGFAHFSGFMAGDYPQYGPWYETWGSDRWLLTIMAGRCT